MPINGGSILKNTLKEIYRSKIKKLIRKAAFEELTVKKNSLTKVKDIKYEAFAIQPYLKSTDFNTKERNLLYSLRSRMYAAKINFRKLHSLNLKCIHGCNKDEDQRHIFEECEILKSNNNIKLYDYIFQDIVKQRQAISAFILIEERRNMLIKGDEDKGQSPT